ncbi:MAG: hypothetical protein IJE63_03860, partial [Clostridia bacterium]|nr:hypothetical protein [Clostridia bacterium]
MENSSNKGYGVIEENQPEKKKKSKSSLVAVLLLVAAILCCLGYIGVLVFQHFTAQQSYGEIEDIAMITPQSNEQATKVDSGDT